MFFPFQFPAWLPAFLYGSISISVSGPIFGKEHYPPHRRTTHGRLIR